MGKLEEEVKKYNIVAIDTNSFIYLMENNPKYFEEIKNMFRLIEAGVVFSVTSILMITEVLTKTLKDENYMLVNRYKAFINAFPNLRLREVDYKVSVRAAKLRAKYGLKTPDAIFVATAFEEGAQAFITNDIKLNRVEGIKMIILDEFI